MCVPEAGSACDPVLGRVVWCLRCTHGTPHNTHTHTHTTHTRARARARAHTHTPLSGPHVRASRSTRWTLLLFPWAPLGAPNVQQRVWRRATEAFAVGGLLPAESNFVAGLQRARASEFARAISWQIVRAPAPRGARRRAGSHGGRGRFPARQMSRGQQEARGARQRVALCFGMCGGRVRLGPSGAKRARANAFWNCVSGFATVRKRLVQANACSGRPRRDPWVAVRMALHSMAHRAAAAWILLDLVDAHLPRCSG